MASIISVSGNMVTVQMTFELSGSMLEMEMAIQSGLNDSGTLATGEVLKRFDTNGDPIQMGSVRMTSKGEVLKQYETPYGKIEVNRHVYQTCEGGETYCPLDDNARIIKSTTPRFSKMVGSKYARLSAKEVMDDLQHNHGRVISRAYLQETAEAVNTIAQSTEESWMYASPSQEELITTIAISLDGTCVPICHEGYREAMTGTISLYNETGERQHTLYLGAAPEHGKIKFLERFEREIYAIKLQYPEARYVGLADGAKSNWEFLEKHTHHHILDFYHATEYLSDVSYAFYPEDEGQRRIWLELACHRLKHDENAASDLLKEMKEIPLPAMKDLHLKWQDAITYFTNQGHRMHYDDYRARHLPIGSGVTEAACKTLVKQRLCQSGMKWKNKGVSIILRLRALVCTQGRWEEFWDRISQVGLNSLAAR